MGRVVGFVVAGVGALVFGGWLLSNYLAFSHFGVTTQAVVSAVGGGRYPDVTVRYVAAGQAQVSTAQEWFGVPRVGDHVAVVFDSREPSRVTDAAVAGSGAALTEALAVVGIGLAALGYALVACLRGRR